MPRESAVVKAIMGRLDRAGAFAVKIHGGPSQRTGLPDIAAVLDGRAVWIEAKVPGNHSTEAQLYQQRLIREAGGWAAEIDDAKKLDDLFEWGPDHVCRECLQHGCTKH